MRNRSISEVIFNKKTLICIATGFTSGLPLYILLQLVPAWLRKQDVSLAEIGLFTLIQLPYAWKFLWAPFLDRYNLPFLGLRRGWMLISQIALLISIAALPWIYNETSLWSVAWLAAAVAFFSATQDILLDAYRRELLEDEELGFGSSVHVNAYRIAGLIPASFSLILADHFNWQIVFAATAGFMFVGIVMTLLISEPEHPSRPRTLQDAVIKPFQEFFGRQGWRHALLILAFLLLYKFGDNLATALSTAFYIDLGFSLTQIGLIAKNAGLWPAIFGGIFGGILMIRIGINKALWLFGFVQIASIFGFALLARAGNDPWILGIAVGFEYLGVGLGTAAVTGFILKTTDKRFSASQIALLTAFATLPRTFTNAFTGFIVEATGWENFFYLCAVCAIPGMLLLLKIAPWGGEEKEKV